VDTPFTVDVSPVYDLLFGMALVARAPQGQERWDIWAREAAAKLAPERFQHLARWFNDESPLGTACVAILPTITGEHSIPAFLAALERLPRPDFLRVMLTSGALTKMPPLGANDLLALVDDRRAAQRYVDRYIGLTGRPRSHMIQLVAEPEAARHDLLDLLSEFAETSFDAIAPSLADERVAAGKHLSAAAYQLRGAPPEWLSWVRDESAFTPAVLAPAVLLGSRMAAYYHELDRSLFDGVVFEPLISVVGTARLFAGSGSTHRSGRVRASPLPSPDPVDRWAQMYAALADPSRLRIVRLLIERPRYGQELATLLGMSGATISHHVGELSKAAILRLERRGQRTYFQIQAESLRALLDESHRYLFENTLDASTENASPIRTRDPRDEAPA
jgi:ArsR family transcriptional regulator, arsenate/arsenite/antimonite-responsive transcriptional repressor